MFTCNLGIPALPVEAEEDANILRLSLSMKLRPEVAEEEEAREEERRDEGGRDSHSCIKIFFQINFSCMQVWSRTFAQVIIFHVFIYFLILVQF